MSSRLDSIAATRWAYSDFEPRWESKIITSEELYNERVGAYKEGYKQAINDASDMLLGERCAEHERLICVGARVLSLLED